MNSKAVAVVLLAVGVILLVLGVNASQSVSSELSEAFTGNPTDQAIWYLIGGTACAILGFVSLKRA